MVDVLGKFSSRKFWLTIAAELAALAGLISGQLSFLEFVAAVVAAQAAYQVGEGLADNGGARPEVEIQVAPPGAAKE